MSREKSKIHAWFVKREKLKNLEEGQRLLISELNHPGFSHSDLKEIAIKAQKISLGSFCYAIGVSDESAADVFHRAIEVAAFQDIHLSPSFADITSEKIIVVEFRRREHTVIKCSKLDVWRSNSRLYPRAF